MEALWPSGYRTLDMKCSGPGFKLSSLLLTKFVLGYIEFNSLAALCILSTGLPFATQDLCLFTMFVSNLFVLAQKSLLWGVVN